MKNVTFKVELIVRDDGFISIANVSGCAGFNDLSEDCRDKEIFSIAAGMIRLEDISRYRSLRSAL
ncbi:hypothetical protein GURASL_13280 [Geotalea uraniireducens]|uniref:Uncharacterized protein n=1 Tax=Geotalea uraniireducens TaxID=351604 RepID=A0ABN6VW48_9BACT|nr:hypothetical protein [Geotalea uraniireducens]BDV42405.1 hypothetical protein GURASL_13280 [Geotalea uraniireducens]